LAIGIQNQVAVSVHLKQEIPVRIGSLNQAVDQHAVHQFLLVVRKQQFAIAVELRSFVRRRAIRQIELRAGTCAAPTASVGE
jgi:hypothetical protein